MSGEPESAGNPRPVPPRGQPVGDAAAVLETTLGYHERTKHRPERHARSLGYLDWETQPDPFRRYSGAELIPLEEVEPTPEPSYDALFVPGRFAPSPVDLLSISQLFYDSLALSAWKGAGGTRWPLRVNPSSGNLHPTEGYLIAGAIPGLLERPAVCHYSPYLHGLEVRLELSGTEWGDLTQTLPHGALIVGLTSIHWRESWKYGERAFRYCQLDVGHAIAAVAMAAAALGWSARLLESVTDDELGVVLGVGGQLGVEAEHPDCLLVLSPGDGSAMDLRRFRLPGSLLSRLRERRPAGEPNRLSESHHDWPVIEQVSTATQRVEYPRETYWHEEAHHDPFEAVAERLIPARRLLRQRRSAVAMDAESSLSQESFFGMLGRLAAVPGRGPLASLPWKPSVHLVLFVHRVQGLQPGLYVLVRDRLDVEPLRSSMHPDLEWRGLPSAPETLDLRLLAERDCRHEAAQIACLQHIAADGAFAVSLLAELQPSLERHGAWFYRRLYWEAGVLGQLLYLEAEAAGLRGTGIGCFFDDAMHEMLGMTTSRYQAIYHFTVGGPVDDERLRTIPAYDHRHRALELAAKPPGHPPSSA